MNELYMIKDGQPHKVGQVITLELDESEYDDEFYNSWKKVIEEPLEFEMTFEVKRKAMRKWLSAFGISKYRITETLFPRKKKRGTKRRRRHENRSN